jgi:hypothetical protein
MPYPYSISISTKLMLRLHHLAVLYLSIDKGSLSVTCTLYKAINVTRTTTTSSATANISPPKVESKLKKRRDQLLKDSYTECLNLQYYY